MHGALHILATIVVLPYVALAIAFALIGQVASSKSLGALLWTLLTQIDWIIPWGILAFVAAIAVIAGLGLMASLRWLGHLSLFVLAFVALLVVVILPGSAIGLGELVFLAPCIAVLVYSAWQAAAGWRRLSSAANSA
ncbi:MAG: hypothetical protein ABIR26_10405 [Ramlibacter sp.]